jgi:hypothetical protein
MKCLIVMATEISKVTITQITQNINKNFVSSEEGLLEFETIILETPVIAPKTNITFKGNDHAPKTDTMSEKNDRE